MSRHSAGRGGAPYNHQTLHQALPNSGWVAANSLTGSKVKMVGRRIAFSKRGGRAENWEKESCGSPNRNTRSEIPHTEGSEISQVSPASHLAKVKEHILTCGTVQPERRRAIPAAGRCLFVQGVNGSATCLPGCVPDQEFRRLRGLIGRGRGGWWEGSSQFKSSLIILITVQKVGNSSPDSTKTRLKTFGLF